MTRPNHFVRPIQSDRMLHDYGNTRLTPDEAPRRRDTRMIVVTLTVLWFFGLGLAHCSASPQASPVPPAGASQASAFEAGAGQGDQP
jgi:hypothetical protein